MVFEMAWYVYLVYEFPRRLSARLSFAVVTVISPAIIVAAHLILSRSVLAPGVLLKSRIHFGLFRMFKGDDFVAPETVSNVFRGAI